jgi:hypothetical protein
MKAIVTTYKGPTATRGSRILVRAEGVPRKSYPYDHGADNVHRQCAEAFRDSFGWQGALIEGGLPNGDRVFVFKE